MAFDKRRALSEPQFHYLSCVDNICLAADVTTWVGDWHMGMVTVLALSQSHLLPLGSIHHSKEITLKPSPGSAWMRTWLSGSKALVYLGREQQLQTFAPDSR